MSNIFLDKLNTECTTYLNSELNTRLLSSSTADKSAACEHYLIEYQRCIDEQNNFVKYINEQMASLETFKSCEMAMDKFLERLKVVHEYEMKQNELFERIRHEIANMNCTSKDEHIRLLGQIDELIADKIKIQGSFEENNPSSSDAAQLGTKSSDTFKNLL